MNDLGIYSLQRDHFEQAIAALCEAFLNDPFFKFMLGPGIDDIWAYAPSMAIEGVALWLPPQHSEITAWIAMRSGVLNLLQMLPGYLRGAFSFAKRMLAYAKYSDRLHKEKVPFPHWYLLAIGIAEKHRGRGQASRLIRPMLMRFDVEKMPCYLETHNQKNIEIYQHFGFEVIDESSLPGSEQRQWAMLRTPAI